MKKVGIIGSGAVGKALAKGFLKYGYDTTIASRTPDKYAALITEVGGNIKTGSFSEVAKHADIIVLAVKGGVAESALDLCGIDHLNGKIIIDATNPIADAAPQNGVLQYFTSLSNSLMEQLQKKAPKAHFVKAFCSVGSAFMVDPDFNGVKPSMFICGNNEDARKEVTNILLKFGWEVEDMGLAEAARAIEPLAMLWCIPGMRDGKWNHAFKLLKK
ncbi:MAG: NAD(P)-binding domain-containing protein [Bacteroidetes bacterium]|nr:NAD(P)-binding domain-containing protein [Bacteroidota bacterium]